MTATSSPSQSPPASAVMPGPSVEQMMQLLGTYILAKKKPIRRLDSWIQRKNAVLAAVNLMKCHGPDNEHTRKFRGIWSVIIFSRPVCRPLFRCPDFDVAPQDTRRAPDSNLAFHGFAVGNHVALTGLTDARLFWTMGNLPRGNEPQNAYVFISWLVMVGRGKQ